MSEIDLLMNDIDKLRKDLTDIIREKGTNLQDPEVLNASKTLNKAIIKYNELILKIKERP